MNRIIFSALLLSAVTANAQQQQVGINTAEPKATLHVEAGASENKGVIIPRITATEMKTMTAGLGADHHSMMTYLKEDLPIADRTGKLTEVTEAGYYFYNHDAAKWEKIGTSGEQDLRYINTNHITKDAGIGLNGTSVGWGVHNIGLGAGVLQSNNLGHQNIAIGAGSLQQNTTGGQNVAHGISVLAFNTTGSNNIAMGSEALRGKSITIPMTGNFNIALGANALQNTTSGEHNIAQGYRALYYNTTGKNNIAIGQTALQGQLSIPMTGNYNIALGADALQNTTTGEHNIAQGYQALYSNTTGNSNIAQGNSALYSNTTGKFNIAQGLSALRNNTTGDFNVAQGYEALTSNTTGGGNVAQGNSALRNNTSGEYNVAQGLSALYNNTTGSHNIAQGFQALFNNTTGANNIAQGNLALFNNTTGKNNIAFGENALKGQILGTPMTGNNNIALGKNALQDNTTGGLNIALGRNALYQNTSGQQNIGIGDGALSDNLTGQFNTAVGGYAGSWIKGNGNVHIGSGGGIPSAELDNVVLIGRLTNTLDATTANDNVILLGDTSPTAPKVGIGTYKPGAKLEVNNGTTAGAVKIVDGTQGAGKVLTSDADGLATWKRQALTLVEGVKGSGISIPPSTGGYIYTGSYITLPPGKYMVSVQNLMSVGFTTYSDGHFWLRTTFSDSDTTFVRTADIDSTKGYLISGLLPQGARFSMLSGSLIIENTTSSPKTYYYWAGQVDVTSGTTKPLQNFGGWAEWSMTATPIQ